jgi:hypothetical protein
LKERFWSVEFYAGIEGDPAPRKRELVATEHLLSTVEALINRFDGEQEICFTVRSKPGDAAEHGG